MANPLLLLMTRAQARRNTLRRRPVDVPTEVPGTDAIFLVLRRMRAPIIALIVIFAVSVFGLTVIDGVDPDGNPTRMTVFDAFYFISYTATTIGFGELPNAFTTPQRLWVTGSIYSSVIGWAYALGTLFALLQDEAFRDAIRTQRFRRRVRRMDEPFQIVAGYGHAGRLICRWLDEAGRRSVVVDRARSRVELLESDQLGQDVPGVEADARHPGVLGLAGLGNRHCEGVLALTDNDHINLAIVMAVNLLRPELPVIARCANRGTQTRMAEFSPAAIVNPYDRYGAYLVLALRKPVTYQLVSWLMSPVGTPLPPLREGLADGRWVVCADGQFGTELERDLRAAGLEVTSADPAAGDPDLTGAVGFVAGTADDTANLALAAHARVHNPDVYLAVRQTAHHNAPLLDAFDLDSVFVATELLARECFARIITPVFWAFLDHASHEPDAWSAGVRDKLIDAVGHRRPDSTRIRLDAVHAPAVARWLARRRLVIGDLLRHPDDRDTTVAAAVVALIRRAPAETEPAPEPRIVFAPDPATPLRAGDELVVLGRESGFRELSDTLFQDSAIEYVATGRQVPTTWLWRMLSRRRRGALEKT